MQIPLTHVEFEQATGDPQPPLELHVSMPLPEHCTAPGAHVPWQTPLTHAEFTQATAVPHCPLALQV